MDIQVQQYHKHLLISSADNTTPFHFVVPFEFKAILTSKRKITKSNVLCLVHSIIEDTVRDIILTKIQSLYTF